MINCENSPASWCVLKFYSRLRISWKNTSPDVRSWRRLPTSRRGRSPSCVLKMSPCTTWSRVGLSRPRVWIVWKSSSTWRGTRIRRSWPGSQSLKLQVECFYIFYYCKVCQGFFHTYLGKSCDWHIIICLVIFLQILRKQPRSVPRQTAAKPYLRRSVVKQFSSLSNRPTAARVKPSVIAI